MGSALARMEVSIILEAIATKMPSMTLATEQINQDTAFLWLESLEVMF